MVGICRIMSDNEINIEELRNVNVFTPLRREGGVPLQKIILLRLDICCSPSYFLFKMGSFVAQFRSVAEI